MATPVKWSKVQVAIQSALGAAKTISAISKANPGVVTATAHGFSDGAFVVMQDIEGMHQLDARVFRIDAAADSPPNANAFTLTGENTTDYDTFVSGTVQAITFGVNMSTATGLNASGGDPEFLDTTTIHTPIRTQIPGLPSAISYSFTNLWDLEDAALLELKAASSVQGERAIRFTFQGGQIVVFSGFVSCTMLPVGQAQQLVETNVSISMNGLPSMYSS